MEYPVEKRIAKKTKNKTNDEEFNQTHVFSEFLTILR